MDGMESIAKHIVQVHWNMKYNDPFTIRVKSRCLHNFE